MSWQVWAGYEPWDEIALFLIICLRDTEKLFNFAY